MIKFDHEKKYKLKDGSKYIFLKYSGICGQYLDDGIWKYIHHYSNGRYIGGKESDYDLVECDEYSDIPVDTLGMATFLIENDKKKRYFAGINEYGHPMVFMNGATSLTSEHEPIVCTKFEVIE